MKINKALNLVCPVEDDGEIIYIHSMPIGLAVFEKYHRVIARAFSSIYADGMNILAGPRVAAMVLKDVALETPRGAGTWWEGTDGVENGLLNEITRLSNVSVCEADGWVSLPLEVAQKRGLIEPETVKEALGKIVFFILCSTMNTGAQKVAILEAMAGLWDVQLTLLNCTEYTNSLPTLIAPVNIPAAE